MDYKGDINVGAIMDFKFTTVNSLGVPTTLAGTPVVSVYKDNGTTQSVAGVTLTVDFDGVTGLNHARVDTAADGAFYSAGSNFQCVITTGTVDSNSVVGYAVGEFSIEARSPLRPTTAGRTLDVDASGGAEVGSFQAGAITAAAIATDAIDADTLAADALAEIKAQIVAALNTDTYAESPGAPGATDTLVAKIAWLATLARNKITQTATTQSLRNDADAANIATAVVSDDGTTFTRAEWI